jgi:hypothetical protein
MTRRKLAASGFPASLLFGLTRSCCFVIGGGVLHQNFADYRWASGRRSVCGALIIIRIGREALRNGFALLQGKVLKTETFQMLHEAGRLQFERIAWVAVDEIREFR